MDPQPTDSPHSPPDAQPRERRLSRRATLLGSIIALLVAGGVGWLAWHLTHPDAGADGGRPGAGARPGGGGAPSARAAGRAATTVGVATAEHADIPIVIDALGTVNAESVRVRPQVSGVLQEVHFKEGQTVRKGDLLAVIDPRQFEMALQQALGQRMRDEAQLQAARVTLKRFQTLLEQDSIARQDVDTQAALVKQLEAAVVTSKANEGTARLNLAYTRVVAPIAGRVGLRTVDEGNVVSTSDANGVALITQMQPIDVEFAVPQDLAPMLQQNAGAFMEAKALDRTRSTVLDTGVFASMDNQIDTQTGTVRAKARFNNARLTLFPSQFVNVRLNVRTIHDAVVVPVSALRHGDKGDFVFVLKEDRTASQRPVTTGQQTVDKVQIVTGLKVGERVITEGADRLRDGSRVVLPGDPPAGPRREGGGGRRRNGASAPAAPGASGAAAAPQASASAATSQAAVVHAQSAPPAGAPTAEQRQRFLESVKDDPQALERRKALLAQIDKGDPAALERWGRIVSQRRDAGGSASR